MAGYKGIATEILQDILCSWIHRLGLANYNLFFRRSTRFHYKALRLDSCKYFALLKHLFYICDCDSKGRCSTVLEQKSDKERLTIF